MRDSWRFINSGFFDAYTNMAVDEALVSSFEAGTAPATLRVYGWEPAAFSVGYRQDPGDVLDLEKCRRDGRSVVRRMTGGGAIYHHRELTYSLVCSRDDLAIGDSVVHSFKTICSFLIRMYESFGLSPQFAVDREEGFGPFSEDHSFCFASREKYDILIEGRKIGGNAQKRGRDVIFQHGSIPLSSSVDKAVEYLLGTPSFIDERVIALEDALGRTVTFEEVAFSLKRSFEEVFSTQCHSGTLSDNECMSVSALKQSKYATAAWNFARRVKGTGSTDAREEASVV